MQQEFVILQTNALRVLNDGDDDDDHHENDNDD